MLQTQTGSLVMFDIDGTLTESNELDDRAYLQSLNEVFGFAEVSSDWASYSHVTDAGILNEICQDRLDRNPSVVEVEAFQQRFLELLVRGAAAAGGVKAISGASQTLKRLLDAPDYRVAYAGGSWRASAIFKLQSANLPVDFPHAFADDDESREGIMEISLSRAEKHYDRSFDRVIYIGDGIWDIRASQNLGYSFIGIASDNKADVLLQAGAERVFANYNDSESFSLALAADLSPKS
jgi:phosphoglycolate phosphatase-like HAD superfamily hydrolase